MKKRNHFLTLLPALFVLLLSGCYFDIDNDGTGPAIRGSGNLSAEERMLPDFDRVLAWQKALWMWSSARDPSNM